MFSDPYYNYTHLGLIGQVACPTLRCRSLGWNPARPSAASDAYLKVCVPEVADGPKYPYWAHRDSLESVVNKLRASRVRTSGRTRDGGILIVD